MQWSKDLKRMASVAVDHALDDCGKEKLHARGQHDFDNFGEVRTIAMSAGLRPILHTL